MRWAVGMLSQAQTKPFENRCPVDAGFQVVRRLEWTNQFASNWQSNIGIGGWTSMNQHLVLHNAIHAHSHIWTTARAGLRCFALPLHLDQHADSIIGADVGILNWITPASDCIYLRVPLATFHRIEGNTYRKISVTWAEKYWVHRRLKLRIASRFPNYSFTKPLVFLLTCCPFDWAQTIHNQPYPYKLGEFAPPPQL